MLMPATMAHIFRFIGNFIKNFFGADHANGSLNSVSSLEEFTRLDLMSRLVAGARSAT
jgi:hypothetical protein